MHRLNGVRFALCFGLMVAGCDSNDSPPLTDEECDDVADALGSVVIGSAASE